MKTGGGNIPKGFLAWCNQEMYHAQWSIMLDEKELQDAIECGVVLTCPDGLKRRFYVRIFTYLADYPEK